MVQRVFELPSLVRLARVIHAASERLFRRSENTPSTYSARSVGDYQGDSLLVREQSVGALLCVAGWLATDVRTLDPVIVDHFGLSPELSLNPAELVVNIREIGGASVSAEKDAFELRGTVTHAALDKAFHSHADKLRGLLISLTDANWDAAQRLSGWNEIPTLIRTNGLVPAMVETNGKQEHRFSPGPHVAFSLAEYEVRELLMGERLYGDPTLAIRELYQNALDACRFREARLTYLQRKHGCTLIDQWKPGIEITQDTDEHGNEYIQCRDYGIGMDRSTLEKCFAKAGSRFADTTEFLEEQADWRSLPEPVEFYPNSQFGVGVFSYFMLADEIRIRTRRLRKDGHPENRMLDVRVPGSGSLFHIREIDGQLTEFPDAGTEITLYLNRTDYEIEGSVSKIDASETLSRLLWIAEFPTSVRHGDDTIQWPVLELRHPEGIPSAMGVTADVWWSSVNEGRVLCDGIMTEMEHPFAVINLRRKHRPELTVDRRQIRNKDETYFQSLLIDNLASLINVPPWLNYPWLWDFANTNEALGRHLLKQFETHETKLRVTVGNSLHSVSASTVGCNSLDRLALHPDLRDRDRDRDRNLESMATLQPKFKANRTRIWRTAIAGNGDTLREAEWHYITWSFKDRIAMSASRDGNGPWLNGTVSVAHILAAAQQLEESSEATYSRIKKYESLCGLELPQVEAEQLNNLVWSENDRIAMSSGLDGDSPWLAGTVSAAHILEAAQELEETPEATYLRIKKYESICGLKLPHVEVEQLNKIAWSENDSIAMSSGLTGESPWLAGAVSAAHILAAAQQLEESPEATYTRIKKYESLCRLDLPHVEAEQLNKLAWSENDS